MEGKSWGRFHISASGVSWPTVQRVCPQQENKEAGKLWQGCRTAANKSVLCASWNAKISQCVVDKSALVFWLVVFVWGFLFGWYVEGFFTKVQEIEQLLYFGLQGLHKSCYPEAPICSRTSQFEIFCGTIPCACLCVRTGLEWCFSSIATSAQDCGPVVANGPASHEACKLFSDAARIFDWKRKQSERMWLDK